jgi:protein-S-isoprenylcysteine O-methyltransferase Ste14
VTREARDAGRAPRVHDRSVNVWRHLAAIGLLPGVVTLLVPAALLAGGGRTDVGWGLPDGVALLPSTLGVGLLALGLLLMIRTVALFVAVGEGTLAPWDPTSRLVVRGPYRHVRNPMISGVLSIVLGEAVLLGSVSLLVWFAAVFAVNAVYMPLVEEPGLVRRFGEDYVTYRAHVRRWVPRARPWDPDG